jgi:outer membrane protein TolC
MNIYITFTLAVTALATPLAATGQVTEVPLTLAEAEQAALDGNRSLAAAEARADAADLGAESRGGFLMPSLQATAGVVRTDDPVGVFGTKLRQRAFTEADFDIVALNDPDAVTDWTAGLGARWDIAQFDRWAERDAGRAESRAARAAFDRTREGATFRTRLLYVAALRAASALDALEAAEASAEATLERVDLRVEQGRGTNADRLQAEAALSGLRARVLRARANLANAREELGSHLGWPADRLPVPSEGADVLNAYQPPDAIGHEQLLARADLAAGRAGVEAAEAHAGVVSARRLPKLEAFGHLSGHTPGFGDGLEWNWTAGVQLSLPIFTGFSLSRGAAAAEAQARALSLEQRQRELEAASEVSAARRSVEASRAALEAARTAAAAADEAARLLQRRYEEGVATVADLLQAEAWATELATGVVDAEANLSMALATLAFAQGQQAGPQS